VPVPYCSCFSVLEAPLWLVRLQATTGPTRIGNAEDEDKVEAGQGDGIGESGRG
jgi:hypothetical protein